MNKISNLHLVFLIALSMAIGCVMTSMIVYEKLDDNSIGGFHCQPIQKVETLEEAKARIKQYQDKVRG